MYKSHDFSLFNAITGKFSIARDVLLNKKNEKSGIENGLLVLKVANSC